MSECLMIVFTTRECANCRRVKQYLNEQRIGFIESDVSMNKKALRQLIRLTGRAIVPTVVYDGRTMIGCDEARLHALIHPDPVTDPTEPELL